MIGAVVDVQAFLLHNLIAFGACFSKGALGGSILLALVMVRPIRLTAEALLVVVLLALWAHPSLADSLFRLSTLCRDALVPNPIGSIGAMTGLLLPLWRCIRRIRRDRDLTHIGRRVRLVWRSTIVCIFVIGIASLSIPMVPGIIAQSDRWNLPNGRLLREILTSCQFVRSQRLHGAEEYMLCPNRLRSGEFPQVLKDALIASEDKDFFAHGAISISAVGRAIKRSVGGNRQGGSTIAQQFARSILLENEGTYRRKIFEAVLAVRIFSILTRDEILAGYMNVVPQARNMHGFDDPARYYFGVKARDLNLAEAALLVGMLPEPNRRDPLKNPIKALNCGIRVLHKLFDQHRITAKQALDAKQELTRRILRGKLRRGNESYAPIEYRPYRDLAVREAKEGGIELGEFFRLIVDMDPEFQRKLVEQICFIDGNHQAAGLFMRPTGEVLAVSGSCVYAGQWNRATDIERSIGSTGKLFPLIGLREKSMSARRKFSTSPIREPNWPAEPNSLCLDRPSVRLDFALAQSCNRPWTKLAIEQGRGLIEIVRRFDITPPLDPALIPIGGIQTSPMKLAQAYASLENDGRLPMIRFLAAVVGPTGNVLGNPATKNQPRVMSQATASLVLNDLRRPVSKGTARAANSVHALVYGKTGTSSYNEDALFVGLTQDFVGSFWAGHDLPTPMPGVHGGGDPAKAFAKMTDYYYVTAKRVGPFEDNRQSLTESFPNVLVNFLRSGEFSASPAAFGASIMALLMTLDLLSRGVRYASEVRVPSRLYY